MASSSRAVGNLLANSVESDVGVNSVSKNHMASLEEKSSKSTLMKGQTSIYSGVNKRKFMGNDNDNRYSAYAYVRARGRSVYLGRFDNEEEAARAHDIVTLKCSGPKGVMNFPASDYKEIMRLTKHMNDDELVAHIKRSGSRFARGCSRYRGVTKHSLRRSFSHKTKKKGGQIWGCYDTQEEAAMAYDIETIKVKGWNAQTNFSTCLYDVEGIRAGTAKPKITAEIANYFQQATLSKPLWAMQECAYGPMAFLLAQNYPSYGFNYRLPPRVDKSYYCLSKAVMAILLAHPNFQDSTMASYIAPQGSVASVNMFRHSNSSCFKPYKRK